jgi:hypothetical protein
MSMYVNAIFLTYNSIRGDYGKTIGQSRSERAGHCSIAWSI